MGRHRRESPIGRLRLKYPKSGYDKHKLYTLYYEYTWLDNAVIRKDTQVRVRVDDWNEKGNMGKGELRSSFGSDYKRMNAMLNGQLLKYDATLLQYAQKHPHRMCKDVIHSILYDAPLTRQDEGKDFIEYVISCLDSKQTKNKIGKSRYENGRSCMNVFREFLLAQNKGTYKPDSIYLGEISISLIDDYITYRREVKKNKDATINHSLTPIIKACERAKDEGLIDTRVYADIKDARVVEQPSLDTEVFDGKSYLTKEQLQQLVNFYNQDTEIRRKEYIEMYLFAFHTGGLRMVDIMTLMWSHINIDKKELRKIQVKTASGKLSRHTIPLTDAAIDILYKWKERNRTSKFVFNLVDDSFNIDNAENLYYVRNSCDRKVNQSLKVVGDRIGLDKPLTFHTARHTFAVLALNDGMSLSMVSRMLGHSSTDITEKVYAEYLPMTLAEELNRLDYYFVPSMTE